MLIENNMAARNESWMFCKKHLITSVTGLRFWRDLVLAGIGPYLNIFKASNGDHLLCKNLLGNSRIHGIRIEGVQGSSLAVFGGKDIRIIHLRKEDAEILTEPITNVVSFPDLIWDVHWLCDDGGKPDGVAIATAHNAVWHWNWTKNVTRVVAQCQEICILYSAKFFGSSLSDLVLACGTVFNQVLLWKVQGTTDEDGRTEVIHRLTGHEGVIFSINFDTSGRLICSVSDDRSIRLWKVDKSVMNLSEAIVEPILLVYGHTARVWDAQLLEKCFVSIGEDSTCIVWNYNGTVIRKLKGHVGRNIWSLAINKSEDLLVTGGGDGSVRLWPLKCIEQEPANNAISIATTLPGMRNCVDTSIGVLKNKETDFPRLLAVLNDSQMLVMTNEGCVHKYSWQGDTSGKLKSDSSHLGVCNPLDQTSDSSWSFLLQDKSYSSYSVMALSPCRKLVAFGNLQGYLKLHDVDFAWTPAEVKPYDGKVLSVQWTSHESPHNLFTCGPEGKMIWWRVLWDGEEKKKAIQVEPLHYFCLPPSKQRWTSAVQIVPKMDVQYSKESCALVCGDRKGSIHLFDATGAAVDEILSPVHSLPVIHGRIGVTDVSVSADGQLYSAGRDGVYRRYRICQSKLQVLDTKKVYKGLEWVEKLIFTPDGDIIIAGFHTSFFVLWSVERNELLMKVKCGGGHRAWDLLLQCTADSRICRVVFAYLKGAQIHTEQIVLQKTLKKPVLKPSFHGREATCICYVGRVPGRKHDVIATGSEDTNINLMTYDSSTGHLTKVFTAQGHISSVRTLCVAECPVTDQTRPVHRGVTSRPASSKNQNGTSGTCTKSSASGSSTSGFSTSGSSTSGSSTSGSSKSRTLTSGTLTSGSSTSGSSTSGTLTSGSSTSGSSTSGTSTSGTLTSETLTSGSSTSGSSTSGSSPAGPGRYLLFSGGGRASLKCWRLDLSAVHVHGSKVTSSPVVFLAEYSERLSKFKRRRLRRKDRTLSEIRFMSLASLCLQRFCGLSEIDRCQSLYAVVAACSDGFVRVFGFDEERGQFSLVAQSQYLKRCVLTVSHVIHQVSHEKPQLLVFAGDTAGKISVCNITTDIQRYVNQALGSQSNLYQDKTKEDAEDAVVQGESSSKVTGMSAQVIDHVVEHVIEHVVESTKPRDDHVNDREGVCLADNTYNSLPSCTSAELEEDCLGDSDCDSDNIGDEAVGDDVDTFLAPPVACSPARALEEAKSFSCMTLVSDFLAAPVRVFQAHQSGVNCVSLVALRDTSRYLLVSGGDDSALFAAEFWVQVDENDVTSVHVTRQVSLPSAHTSSITGVRVLEDGKFMSTSVDQRLKLWTFCCSVKESSNENSQSDFIRENVTEFVDIPDVQDLEVWRVGDDCLAVGICGVGIQILHLSCDEP